MFTPPLPPSVCVLTIFSFRWKAGRKIMPFFLVPMTNLLTIFMWFSLIGFCGAELAFGSEDTSEESRKTTAWENGEGKQQIRIHSLALCVSFPSSLSFSFLVLWIQLHFSKEGLYKRTYKRVAFTANICASFLLNRSWTHIRAERSARPNYFILLCCNYLKRQSKKKRYEGFGGKSICNL